MWPHSHIWRKLFTPRPWSNFFFCSVARSSYSTGQTAQTLWQILSTLSNFSMLEFSALGSLLFSTLSPRGPHPSLCFNSHLHALWLSRPYLQTGLPLSSRCTHLTACSQLSSDTSGHLNPNMPTTKLLISPPKPAPPVVFSILVSSPLSLRPNTWELTLILLFVSYWQPIYWQVLFLLSPK